MEGDDDDGYASCVLPASAASFNEDIGAWDTSGVTRMNYLFYQALSFNQDIGGWAVHRVESMYQIFSHASAFDQDLGWCVDGDDVGLRDAFGKDVADCPTPARKYPRRDDWLLWLLRAF
jgi:hypothetical protein